MFRKSLLRGEGFTLIELLAVMAIVAVLAAIIAVAVSGSGETSKDTQTVNDGTTIETAAAEFFGNATGASLVEKSSINGSVFYPYTVGTSGNQVTSSLWPEDFISATYATELFDSGAAVTKVILTAKDGTTEQTVKDLLEKFTAISFSDLETANVLTSEPDSFKAVSKITNLKNGDKSFHNFLWLFEKDTAAGSTGSVDSRNVVIYKLVSITVVSDGKFVELSYLRIF